MKNKKLHQLLEKMKFNDKIFFWSVSISILIKDETETQQFEDICTKFSIFMGLKRPVLKTAKKRPFV